MQGKGFLMWSPDQSPVRNVKPLCVGYVVKRFPRLSETFVLSEILELERQGCEVEVYSLLEAPEAPRYELVQILRAPVNHLYGADALSMWRQMLRQSGGRQLSASKVERLLASFAAPMARILSETALASRLAAAARASAEAKFNNKENVRTLRSLFEGCRPSAQEYGKVSQARGPSRCLGFACGLSREGDRCPPHRSTGA